jgi:hypothetical protein
MLFYPSGILFLLLSLWDELEVYGKQCYTVLLLGIFAGYLRYNNLPGCTIPITVQKKNPSRSEIYLTGSGGDSVH